MNLNLNLTQNNTNSGFYAYDIYNVDTSADVSAVSFGAAKIVSYGDMYLSLV